MQEKCYESKDIPPKTNQSFSNKQGNKHSRLYSKKSVTKKNNPEIICLIEYTADW